MHSPPAILVAADFSENSQEAFHLACSIARKEARRVVVLHVLEPKLVPEGPVYHGQQTVQFRHVARRPAEIEALRTKLREAYTPNDSLAVEYLSREGDAAEEILGVADEFRSELIVMGTHGRTGLLRMLTGSVAEEVLRKSRCPVLALRAKALRRQMAPIQVILHPTDFSEGSESALRTARELARDQGARLVLLHVTPILLLEGAMASGLDPDFELDSLEMLRERMDGPDLAHPVEIRLENGRAAPEILRVAEEIGADLIVMGMRGRSGLARLLIGSEAEGVLRRASCPVLVVKDTGSSGARVSAARVLGNDGSRSELEAG